jgi:hypothetical protein
MWNVRLLEESPLLVLKREIDRPDRFVELREA